MVRVYVYVCVCVRVCVCGGGSEQKYILLSISRRVEGACSATEYKSHPKAQQPHTPALMDPLHSPHAHLARQIDPIPDVTPVLTPREGLQDQQCTKLVIPKQKKNLCAWEIEVCQLAPLKYK